MNSYCPACTPGMGPPWDTQVKVVQQESCLALQCIPATESATSSGKPPKVQIQGLLLTRAPHFLPPYVLLSAEAPPGHHPRACPPAPVPTTPLAAHPSWAGCHSPPHPLPAAPRHPSLHSCSCLIFPSSTCYHLPHSIFGFLSRLFL